MSDNDLPGAAARGLDYSQGRADLSQPPPTKDVAADEAASVARDAKSSAADVAGTAQEQAGAVVNEATDQLKTLFHQLKGEFGGQSADQQKRLASGLGSLADELDGMARGSEQRGVASDVARQVSSRARDAATWMENREPGEVVEEVKRFARRRPGAFLVAAAAVGLVAGRMTRGLADEARDDSKETVPAQPARPYVAGEPEFQPTGYATPAVQHGIGEQYAEQAADPLYGGGDPDYQPVSPRPPEDLR